MAEVHDGRLREAEDRRDRVAGAHLGTRLGGRRARGRDRRDESQDRECRDRERDGETFHRRPPGLWVVPVIRRHRVRCRDQSSWPAVEGRWSPRGEWAQGFGPGGSRQRRKPDASEVAGAMHAAPGIPRPRRRSAALAGESWRARRDSNPRPSGPQPDALSTELRARDGWRRGRDSNPRCRLPHMAV